MLKNAFLDNDFMKNLDMSQIIEIVECMYSSKLASGSFAIKEGETGNTVYVIEGKNITYDMAAL